MAEFIYVLDKARKAHGDKVILDDVTLAFLPGAKIGVVGPNGMGKSTLLKIMAGLEEVSNGEARLTPGYTVGLLQQEPPLEEDKTVEITQPGNLQVTGILVGGQPQKAEWNWVAAAATDRDYVVYDTQIPDATIPLTGILNPSTRCCLTTTMQAKMLTIRMS